MAEEKKDGSEKEPKEVLVGIKWLDGKTYYHWVKEKVRRKKGAKE